MASVFDFFFSGGGCCFEVSQSFKVEKVEKWLELRVPGAFVDLFGFGFVFFGLFGGWLVFF